MDPYLSELRMFSFNFAPKNWAMCNGQFLSIAQNQALFALLGTTYGGNGQTTFALPNLRGRVPLHVGSGFTLGQASGATAHTLTINEMAAHTHLVNAKDAGPNVPAASGNFFASNTGFSPYATTPNTLMATQASTSIGGNQPHTNMSPYTVLNICIALAGIFPSRN